MTSSEAKEAQKSECYWIGAGILQSAWRFHDSSEVDFFRILVGQRLIGSELGMLLQRRPRNNSNIGYTVVEDANKEFSFICSRPINNVYARPIKTIKFHKTETTTTRTTKATTRYPIIENPKEWITDPIQGQLLYRSYNNPYLLHYYTLNPVYKPEGFVTEKTPGFVVSEQRFPLIENTCPELIKVGIWRWLTMSYIGVNPPLRFTLSESFYCSPRQFYCGANFLLRRVDKKGGGDIFYASEENEANILLTVQGPLMYQQGNGGFLETPCWVWQNHTDTNATIVKAAGSMLWSRGDIYSYYQGSFSTDMYETVLPQPTSGPQGGAGYVIFEELYESYFKEKCPELIPIRVWHGSNGGQEYNTYFGPDGEPPAPHINQKVYQEARKFYCAPRMGYCGAEFLLRRCDRISRIANFFPQSWYPGFDAAEWQQVMWARKQEICYVWKNWYHS